MRAAVLLALAAAVAGLAVRSVRERAHLRRLDLVTGAWRTSSASSVVTAVAAHVARQHGACGEPAPALAPGMPSFVCSRPVGHEGAHVAMDSDGQTCDTWSAAA